MDRATPTKDFFICYVQDDQPWAEWIAFTLEEAGYTTIIRAWDIRPGSNMVLTLDQALQKTRRIIVICSPSSLQTIDTTIEWAIAFQRDPQGTHQQLIPVQIRPCILQGVLSSYAPINLIGYSEQAAREQLLTGIQQQRQKPIAVSFPLLQEQVPAPHIISSACLCLSPSSQNHRTHRYNGREYEAPGGDIPEAGEVTTFSGITRLVLRQKKLSLIIAGLLIGWWLGYRGWQITPGTQRPHLRFTELIAEFIVLEIGKYLICLIYYLLI